MSYLIGKGRYARETYPEAPRSGAAPAPSDLGFGLYAARPAPGNLGHLWTSSDGATIFQDDGTNWRPLIGGRPGTQVPLVAAFPNVYGAATWTDSTGTVLVRAPGLGTQQMNAITEAIPGASWSATAHLSSLALESNDLFGAGIVASDGTTFLSWKLDASGFSGVHLTLSTWDTTTGPITTLSGANQGAGNGLWLRLESDGADVTASTSPDGVNFSPVFVVADPGWTQVGFMADNESAGIAVFDSWELS
jgi:hypothetical protein